MYYVIQVYMFDAFFSAALVDELGDMTLRSDLNSYVDLINECYKEEIFTVILNGDNTEYIHGLIEEIKALERNMFNENKIQFQVMKIAEVIPE